MFLILFGVNLLYIPLASYVLEIFHCVDDALDAAPFISCSSSEYKSMRTVAILGLIGYVLAVPIYFLAGLFPGRHIFKFQLNPDLSPDIPSMDLCFLWQSVKPELYWWRVVVVTNRSFLLAAAVSLLPRMSILIPFAIFLILALSIVLQVLFVPYATRLDNILECNLLITALVTYLVEILALNRFSSVDGLRTFVAVWNDLLLLFCVLLLLRKQILYALNWCLRKSGWSGYRQFTIRASSVLNINNSSGGGSNNQNGAEDAYSSLSGEDEQNSRYSTTGSGRGISIGYYPSASRQRNKSTTSVAGDSGMGRIISPPPPVHSPRSGGSGGIGVGRGSGSGSGRRKSIDLVGPATSPPPVAYSPAVTRAITINAGSLASTSVVGSGSAGASGSGVASSSHVDAVPPSLQSHAAVSINDSSAATNNKPSGTGGGDEKSYALLEDN